MIEPMIKYSFLVYHQDYEVFLEDLRQLGLVHIIEKQKNLSTAIQEKFDHINRVKSTLKSLIKREIKKAPASTNINGEEAYKEVSKAIRELESIQQQSNNIDKEIRQLKPWGYFSNKNINALIDNNINIRFYTATNKKYDENWRYKYPIEEIARYYGQVYFILVGDEELPEELPVEPVNRPEKSLKDLMAEKERLTASSEEINKRLDTYAAEALDAIDLYCRQLIEEVEYESALENTESSVEDKIRLLEGWITAKKEQALQAYLQSKAIPYIRKQAKKEDKPPIALRNNKFTKKFETLTELYSLPKYGELDMTPFFAPFYALFFGFCLGDAGYGALMAIAALVLKSKVPKAAKQAMSLVFYLGLTTILFGVISGTVFGVPLYDSNIPLYVALSEKLSAQNTDINNFLFNLSLVLGAIQIIFGLCLKAINETRQFGWKTAVGTMGWLTLIVGAVAIYGIGNYAAITPEKLKPFWYALLIVSGTMILLLNDMTRNVFKNFGLGLWNSYNMLTGLLGDLLSYIRLFALGISSAILGFVFNSLAIQMSGDIPVLNILIMVVILVIGHGINLFMSGIGAFVHPLRLTFVEFYKNAGFTGGGKKYNPFRKIT